MKRKKSTHINVRNSSTDRYDTKKKSVCDVYSFSKDSLKPNSIVFFIYVYIFVKSSFFLLFFCWPYENGFMSTKSSLYSVNIRRRILSIHLAELTNWLSKEFAESIIRDLVSLNWNNNIENAEKIHFLFFLFKRNHYKNKTKWFLCNWPIYWLLIDGIFPDSCKQIRFSM